MGATPTFNELIVASAFIASASFTMTFVTIFVIANFLIFKLVPFFAFVFGIGILTTPQSLLTFLPHVNFSSIGGSEQNYLIVILGFLATSMGWNTIALGNGKCGKSKAIYALLVALCSFVALKNHHGAGECSAQHIISSLQHDRRFLGYSTLLFSSVVAGVGHFMGPSISNMLELKSEFRRKIDSTYKK